MAQKKICAAGFTPEDFATRDEYEKLLQLAITECNGDLLVKARTLKRRWEQETGLTLVPDIHIQFKEIENAAAPDIPPKEIRHALFELNCAVNTNTTRDKLQTVINEAIVDLKEKGILLVHALEKPLRHRVLYWRALVIILSAEHGIPPEFIDDLTDADMEFLRRHQACWSREKPGD